MSETWKKLETFDRRTFIDETDKCWYMREYTSKGGYDINANGLIMNFKKSKDRMGQVDWKYKKEAEKQFAHELSLILPDNSTIMFMPTSKVKRDCEYDNRFEDTYIHLNKINSSIIKIEPFELIESQTPTHKGGSRDYNDIMQNYRLIAGKNLPKTLYIIDDVVTTGVHYKVCKNLLLSKKKDIELFWTKTVWMDT